MRPTLVILAAGMGSRYGGNKQTDSFGPSGETIMEYTIYDAIKAGYGKIVFVIKRAMKDSFEPIIKEKVGDRIELAFVYQELDVLPEGLTVPEGREKPWGTGHALWVSNPEVSEAFAMANADDFYGFEGLKAMADTLISMDNSDLGACIVGYRLSNTLSDHGSVNRGVCQTENGYLTEIEEILNITKSDGKIVYEKDGTEHELTGDEPVSMNLMGYTVPVFDVMEKGFIEFWEEHGQEANKKEYLTPTVFQVLMDRGVKIPVPETDSPWFGVTYQEDKPLVQQKLKDLIDQGIYPDNLWG